MEEEDLFYSIFLSKEETDIEDLIKEEDIKGDIDDEDAIYVPYSEI
jgi:hypothetical protein